MNVVLDFGLAGLQHLADGEVQEVGVGGAILKQRLVHGKLAVPAVIALHERIHRADLHVGVQHHDPLLDGLDDRVVERL